MPLDAQARISREKLSFPNRDGQQLAALLERPVEPPRAYAIFAHCFTCSKDIGAATRISRALAARGIAVLRFDFTGLGNSEGDFANTNFSSNVEDLVCAADHLRAAHRAPDILIGHSLGGAAVLAAAGRIPEAQAVVTLGAPSDPGHVSHLFHGDISTIEAQGYAEVDLAGRRFTIKRQFLDDIEEKALLEDVRGMRKALLVLHSPVDEIVNIEHARQIYEGARHPKSFISLDQADHLLSRREDSEYAAETIAAWAGRYVSHPGEPAGAPAPEVQGGEVIVRESYGKYTNEVYTETHRLLTDEPIHEGGQAMGPTPYEYLLAALGGCTSITLRMYASFKDIPLDHVEVHVRKTKSHAEDCKDCDGKEASREVIQRVITLKGDFTEAQRQRLLHIADRCPVHRTLSRQNHIETWLHEDSSPPEPSGN
jgi:putative redox protein